MLLEFLYPLVKYFTPLNVFQYLTFRAAYAALTTLVICFVFGPKVIAGLKKIKASQAIREDGPATHQKKSGTPTMGGVLIILAVVVSCLLWQEFHNYKVWLTLGAFVCFGVVGFVDDYLKVARRDSAGIPGSVKFLCQCVIALAVVLVLYFIEGPEVTLLYIPFFKNPVVDLGLLWVPFGVLMVVGESNAVNLSDGLDGLASGLLIPTFIALAILSYLTGHSGFSAYLGIPYIEGAGELTILTLALVGACTGFLWFNAHPAEVFMGDVGSLSLGGVVGVISLILKKEILILVIGGVFVLEVASVIIQVLSFKIWKKRVFRMAPLHHNYEMQGWSETKVVTRFWILGGLFAIIALSTLKIQ